jgi:hypothetical protein
MWLRKALRLTRIARWCRIKSETLLNVTEPTSDDAACVWRSVFPMDLGRIVLRSQLKFNAVSGQA